MALAEAGKGQSNPQRAPRQEVQFNSFTAPNLVQKQVIDHYEVNKPFAYVMITKHPLTNEIMYEVVEPTLTAKGREVLARIKELMKETLQFTLNEVVEKGRAEEYLKSQVRQVVKKFRLPIKRESLEKLEYYVIRDFLGYGKIDVMMRDPLIEDISLNGVNVPIYVWHRIYESIPTNVLFESDEELDSFIIRLAYRSGRMISVARPMIDATLPDGSRIQMTLGREVTKHGSTFTIRKFRADPITVTDMIRYNTMSSEMGALLWYLIENRLGVFVLGGVASGKTTMLNVLSTFIKPDMKIVTIEDTAEIQLYHKNWLRAVTRPSTGGEAMAEVSLFDLLKAALRQRPDYIIVGEVRGEEAYTLFQAMSTGHLGMATLHAESVQAAIHRLESEPMNIPRTLIAQMHLATLQARLEREGRPVRRTITVTEVVGLDPSTNNILLNEIFRYDQRTDTYRFMGRSHHLERIAKFQGISLAEVSVELQNRKQVLEWMAKKNIRSFKEVTEIIRNYYANPEEVVKTAQLELSGS